ncbi:hypothetical protein [Arthrobacter sp. UYCo732]|uniref:hypothetical protein n=1 Tax=Arthrobacter sp. UYCo732 TaxID=3156336 RepID=UPI00339A7CB5
MTQLPMIVDAAGMGALLEKHPHLTTNGIEELGAVHFAEHRQDMYSNRVQLEVNHCLAFLSAFTTIKTPKASSYSLKHRAEKWGVGDTRYVHNGSAIAAGVLLDLPVRFDGLNPQFGISAPELDWIFYDGRKPYAGARIRQPRGWEEFLRWRASVEQI